jgi:CBS domain-containing protein
VIELAGIDGLTAADLIHRRITTAPAAATVAELRAYFDESSSHKLAVLVDGDRYVGSLTPADLPPGADDASPAAGYATPEPFIRGSASAEEARDAALAHPSARMPVVDDAGDLVGVVAINSARDGFCGT